MKQCSDNPARSPSGHTTGMEPDPLREDPQRLTISLKTLATLLDANRTSIRRWLATAGIKPIALGRGRNGAIRYRWREVEDWLNTRETVD